MNKKDEVERKITSIFDHAKFQALALICAEPDPIAPTGESLPEYLTEEELMRYWRLDSTAGIQSWRKRPANQFPLPYRNAGVIRYNRKEADQWWCEETARRDAAKIEGSKKQKRPGLSVVQQQEG